jgi:hypothetical protein
VTDDHENWRASRDEAVGLAVLRAAFGSSDVTVHSETCVGSPDCTCDPLIVHINHRPDDEHEDAA